MADRLSLRCAAPRSDSPTVSVPSVVSRAPGALSDGVAGLRPPTSTGPWAALPDALGRGSKSAPPSTARPVWAPVNQWGSR